MKTSHRSSKKKHVTPPSHEARMHLSNFAPPPEKASKGISRGSTYWKLQPRRVSKHRPESSAPSSSIAPSSVTLDNEPRRIEKTVMPGKISKIAITDLSSLHLLNSRKASSDEIAFMAIAEEFGIKPAAILASRFNLHCQRQLQALKRKPSKHTLSLRSGGAP